MIFWELTIISIVTIFIFRAIPFLFKSSSFLDNNNGIFYRFLSYSTQAMLGAIVYSSAFDSKSIETILKNFDATTFVKITMLIVSFIAVAKIKKIVPVFLSLLVLYGVWVFICP